MSPRLSTSGIAAALSLGLGCASAPLPRAPDLVAGSPEQESRRDREALSKLTALLGGPLPAPAPDDVVGVEEPAFEVTRAFLPISPPLCGRPTRVRATAFRGRVHTLEVTFPGACEATCAAALSRTLHDWLGPLHAHQEGRAHFLTAELDTVRVQLEAYPSRPDLTRLLLVCVPLANAAAGRPSILGPVGAPYASAPPPRCRPLPTTRLGSPSSPGPATWPRR